MITEKLTVKDLIEAQRLHYAKSSVVYGLFILIAWSLITVLLLECFNLCSLGTNSIFVLMIMAFAITMAIALMINSVISLSISYNSKRYFSQQKLFSVPSDVQFNDEGIFIEHQFAKGVIPWNHLTKYKFNESMILLYTSDYSFHIFPLRFFARKDYFDQFIVNLNQNNVPQAK